ncbi:MAG: T9SS type A sorting domain-containing protein, partial [Deltaproteobacteria bacterium]|nr:T9SS type A sorting domain-containing protein [Deltaproteobacteria bacterium]
ANYGGGIACYESNPTISNNIITGNSSGEVGGGISCFLSSPSISNNIITGNSSGEVGGGVGCESSGSPTISNNTITGNSAEAGGGILCSDSSPLITNTILWADSASDMGNEIFVYGGSPVITYCDIEGGWSGEGNIDVDPLFRDPDNGDFHLQSITNPDCGGPGDSPCIDAGDPTIFDSMLDCDWGLGAERSDMGAYGGEGIPTNIEEDIPAIPAEFILSQNYPNPFNATTVIQYSLPSASDVAIDIYDLLGRKVETLIDQRQQAGYHQVIWNAKDKTSGVYFYRIKGGDYTETKKMLLLK